MAALLKKLRTGPYRYQKLVPPLPRRFHAFSVGTSKSGTSSIHALFERHYRSAHEPAHGEIIDAIIARESGALSADQMQALLRERGRSLRLEMDSSVLNGLVIEDLVAAFPTAKFILTLRDCYSYFDSVTNHHVSHASDEAWKRLQGRETRRGSTEYAPGESVLKEHGLGTTDRTLLTWASHNQRVLECVPDDRLLIVRTRDLSNSLDQIADFLGINVESLPQSRAHSFQRKSSAGLAAAIDRDYLEAKVEEHCRSLMQKYFPEIRRFEDAIKE